MRKIKAYVHRDRVADVITAIKQSAAWIGKSRGGSCNLAVCAVKSPAAPADTGDLHYEVELGDTCFDSYKIELLCEDMEVDALVDSLAAAARTGRSNSGWITVSELARAMPIR